MQTKIMLKIMIKGTGPFLIRYLKVVILASIKDELGAFLPISNPVNHKISQIILIERKHANKHLVLFLDITEIAGTLHCQQYLQITPWP